MAQIIQIEKAAITYRNQVIEDIEIKIHQSVDLDKCEDVDAVYKADAKALFEALRGAIPGGTFDQLLILMLQATASRFIVPHRCP